MKYNASAVMVSLYSGSPTPVKKLIAEQTKCSLKLDTTMIDVTSKQNDGWKEELGGLQSGEVVVEFFDDSETASTEVNLIPLVAAWMGRTKEKWCMESNIVGTLNWEFYARVKSLDLNRDMETGAAGSMTLSITARPTTTVVAS
ncbi:phage tail protein [Spirosoma fluminis]